MPTFLKDYSLTHLSKQPIYLPPDVFAGFLFLAGWKTAECQQVTALTPAQLQQAYFKSRSPSQCITIAIIDPVTNNVTSALSDLAAYRAAFGQPLPS